MEDCVHLMTLREDSREPVPEALGAPKALSAPVVSGEKET